MRVSMNLKKPATRLIEAAPETLAGEPLQEPLLSLSLSLFLSLFLFLFIIIIIVLTNNYTVI